MRTSKTTTLRRSTSLLLAFALVTFTCPLNGPARPPAIQDAQAAASGDQAAPAIPPDQLDSLVAPIALYPDPLLAQVLAASTYPLELIQLQQWLGKNKGLKDKALVDAVSKQPWDPSVQAMAALPDVVKRLTDDIQWTTDLGNAFLAQQADVMDAVQRMRKKAQEKGNLKSNEQMKVETQTVESKQVIVVQQAQPQVVYVPSYDPVVVYGPPVYAYPPIYYPPPPPSGWAVAGGMALSFGVGVAMGAAWGGGWGWGCGWGHGDVNVNVNNNFNRNTNIQGGNRTNVQGGNRAANRQAGGGGGWQHNPQHRGGAPYSNRQTANKFGGTARGDSLSNRQAGARQQIGRQGGNVGSNRGGAGGPGGVGGAGGAGGAGRPGGAGGAGGAGRPGGAGGVGGAGGAGGAGRPGGAGGAGKPGGAGGVGGAGGAGGAGNRGGAGGGDKVGNRSVSDRSAGGDRSAFGSSGGSSGSSARASSNRGSSSVSGSRGGGSRGGGGGGRSGGGGRRR